MAISQAHMTLEEFLRLPDEEPALEYFAGRVTQKVSQKGPHSLLQLDIGSLINGHALPRSLGRAFSEARVTFGGESPVPDLVYYCWDRIPRTPGGRIAEDFTTPPDLVVEIISPGQRVAALTRRCCWYVDNGVRAVLLVDPRRERVLVFRPAAEPVQVAGDDPVELEEVLPGFRLTARQLFAALYLR